MITRFGATIAISLLCAAPTYAAEHDQAAAEKAVEAFAANYLKMYNSKDAAGIANLFAEDGLEVPPLPMVTGKDNIEKLFASIFAAGATDLHYEIKKVKAEGDLVYAIGQFAVKLPKSQGAGLQDIRGNFVNIYEWQGDDLRYRVHSYNFVPPSP